MYWYFTPQFFIFFLKSNVMFMFISFFFVCKHFTFSDVLAMLSGQKQCIMLYIFSSNLWHNSKFSVLSRHLDAWRNCHLPWACGPSCLGTNIKLKKIKIVDAEIWSPFAWPDRSTNACIFNGEDDALCLLQQLFKLLGLESPFFILSNPALTETN